MLGLTVHEAAERLHTSESSVRRLVGGTLRALPGPGPLRVDADSVEQARVARILALGGFATKMCSAEHEGLEAENLKLKQVIQDLLVSSGAMADAVRELTQPDIPNN